MGAMDYLVLGGYGVLMLWLGLVARRRSDSLEEYFAAGHRLPWWMAAISHHVSGYSAVVFVGFAGKAAGAGLSMWTLFSVPCFIALMIGALLWAPRWARLRVLTPVEYLEARFGGSVRLAVALAGIGVKFIDLGIKLYALALVVQVCTGWELTSVIAGVGAVTVAYVLVGGLWATVLTDLAQFVVQLGLSGLVMVVVLQQMGGWGTLWDRLPAGHTGLLNPDAGIGLGFWMVYLVVIIMSYNGATWGLAQRFIAVETPRQSQKVAMLSGFLFLLYPLVIFIPAWAAPFLLPGHFDPATHQPLPGFDPDHTYVLLAQQVLSGLGPGLVGLLVCSMFAATMSMVDSDLNALAAVFTRDVYQRCWGAQDSTRQAARVGRAATLVFGLAVLATALAVARAPGVGKVFEQTVKLFAAILPPVAVPLMCGMLWRRTTARGALLAMAGGFATFVVLKWLYPADFAVYTGGEILVALLLFFGEGLVSRHPAGRARQVAELFDRLEGRSAPGTGVADPGARRENG
ncbi:MAG: sodium/solute symporter [Candidatus Latescibacterota bacterium]